MEKSFFTIRLLRKLGFCVGNNINKPKGHVLILDGDATQALALIEYLHKSGYEISTVCPGKLNYGYYAMNVKHRFIGPKSSDKQYYDFIIELLKTQSFDVLIPTSDETAMFISKHKVALSQYAGVFMPDYEVFMAAYDKNMLMTLCKDNGYPHPRTLDLSKHNQSDLVDFPFPALIKPNLTTGARGMTLVHNVDELNQYYPSIHAQYGKCHLQQYIPQGGKQIKVQIITDRNSKTLYSSVIWKQRYYPIKGGSSCCNVSINNDEVVNICSNILRDIKWVGFADFDLIENPNTGELLIMEINPRVPACVRTALKSGVDYATMIADMTMNRAIEEYHYQAGKKLRHLGFEILWLFKSPERFSTKPSWFNFFDCNLYYQDFVGINFLSFLLGTIGNIKKQLNPEFRKAKDGVR